jgi:hypothetical protein
MLGRSHMRPNGLVDRDLWLLAEPHLDAGAFTSPFGSSYLNVVTYRARSMVRYWRAPALVTAVLAAPLPLLPIDTFTASGALSGAAALAAADPEAPAELDEHLQEVAQSFHAAMRPEEYLAHNEQLWDALHDMLAPQAPAPLRRLPYPFRASMLALLSTELPHLVAPTAAGGGAGAGAGEGAGAASSAAVAAAARVLCRGWVAGWRRHRPKGGALRRWKPWCCVRRAPRWGPRWARTRR